VFPRDVVCLRHIRVDTLHKGDIDDDDDDDDDNNNNNNNNNRLRLTILVAEVLRTRENVLPPSSDACPYPGLSPSTPIGLHSTVSRYDTGVL
jgi:hypothetical protein